jgi:xanthosine utilization system XapX-like protein
VIFWEQISPRLRVSAAGLWIGVVVALLAAAVIAAPAVSLIDAVKSGDRASVRRLIAQHVNVNAP